MGRPLVLDTHAWVWLAFGDRKLKPAARSAIAAAASAGSIRVAAISLWEIALLARRGRLDLQGATVAWFREALANPGIELVPLSPEIAVEAAALPPEVIRDPADRLILATARVLGAALVTSDESLLRYCGEGHVATLAT